MSYFLNQVTADDTESPIKIRLHKYEVCVGRKSIPCLKKYRQISKEHAVLYKAENGTLLIKDLNSLNGVFVNGKKIGTALKPLSVGDVISFGVPPTQTRYGFVCTLCVESTHDDSNASTSLEVIDLTNDSSNRDIKPEPVSPYREPSDGMGVERVKLSATSNRETIDFQNCNVNSPAAERIPDMPRTFTDDTLKSHQIKTKKCTIPLIKCDSKYFDFPPVCKNAFTKARCDKYFFCDRQVAVKNLSSDPSLESDEASSSSPFVKTYRSETRKHFLSKKKRVRKLSSDSSSGSYEEVRQSSCRKTQNQNQKQTHKRRSANRQKRVRKLTTDSSDENIEEVLQSLLFRNTQDLTLNESEECNWKNSEDRVRKLSSNYRIIYPSDRIIYPSSSCCSNQNQRNAIKGVKNERKSVRQSDNEQFLLSNRKKCVAKLTSGSSDRITKDISPNSSPSTVQNRPASNLQKCIKKTNCQPPVKDSERGNPTPCDRNTKTTACSSKHFSKTNTEQINDTMKHFNCLEKGSSASVNIKSAVSSTIKTASSHDSENPTPDNEIHPQNGKNVYTSGDDTCFNNVKRKPEECELLDNACRDDPESFNCVTSCTMPHSFEYQSDEEESIEAIQKFIELYGQNNF